MLKLKNIIQENIFKSTNWKEEIFKDKKIYDDVVINDLYITIQSIIPSEFFPITYGDENSIKKYITLIPFKNNPFKINVIVKVNNKTVKFIADKYDSWRSHWHFEKDGQPIKDTSDLLNVVREEILTPLQNYKYHAKRHDYTYNYSDDNSSYRSGVGHEKYMKQLYDRLADNDKKEATEFLKQQSKK